MFGRRNYKFDLDEVGLHVEGLQVVGLYDVGFDVVVCVGCEVGMGTASPPPQTQQASFAIKN